MSRSTTDAPSLTATEVRNNPAALAQLRKRLLSYEPGDEDGARDGLHGGALPAE